MKKSYLIILLFGLILSACKEEKKIDYNLLAQSWLFKGSDVKSLKTAPGEKISFRRYKGELDKGLNGLQLSPSGKMTFFKTTGKSKQNFGYSRAVWGIRDGNLVIKVYQTEAHYSIDRLTEDELTITLLKQVEI